MKISKQKFTYKKGSINYHMNAQKVRQLDQFIAVLELEFLKIQEKSSEGLQRHDYDDSDYKMSKHKYKYDN